MYKYFLVLLFAAAAAQGQASLSNLSTVWASSLKLVATSLVIDGDGNSYLLGSGLTGFTPTNPVYGSGGPDTVVAKFDPLGNLIWSTGLSNGWGSGLAIDSAKNVYITGGANGYSFPTTPGAFQTWLNKKGVAYAAKLNGSTGLLEWATLLGAPDNDSEAYAIAVNDTGVFIAGNTYGPSFPTTPGAFQQTPTGGSLNESFITKLNLAGSALVFSTLLGGSGPTDIFSIAIDDQGAVYALGQSSSLDFPVTPGAYKSRGCVFLSKLNPAGSSLVFSTFVPGINSSGCGSTWVLSLDSGGNSYILASPHILKINSTGTELVYDRMLGGNLGADLFDLVTDPSGNVFVAGSTLSSDFPIAAPCFQSVAGVPTALTGFILRLDASGAIADGGYLPLPANSNRGGAVLRMDSGGNFYILNDAVRKFIPGAGGAAALRCVANAGHFGKAPVAPGEIVSLFGDGIGPDQPANLALDATGKVANVLANTRVFFDGIPAPLSYAQSRQINAVVPWELQGRKTTEACVVYAGAKTNCITLPVSEVSPGFFRIQPGYLAALNEDSTINSTDNPAKKGSIVTLFLTGSGPSVPPQADGEVTQGAPPSADAVQMLYVISLGPPRYIEIRNTLDVVWHGAAPALVSGVEVIQIRIPIGFDFQAVSVTMQSSTGVVFQDRGIINVVAQ